MKLPIAFSKILTILATATLTSVAIDNSLQAAATFDEQQIEQNQIIAIARPYGGNRYDLLVIEQIPGKQQCWSESGSNPTLVEPLLLKFDFTGHCSRSTDSNGYSIRIEGQDLGLNYLLRIVERNGELFLVGTSRTNPGQRDIVVGRTYGIQKGFLKIHLNAGWEFSKRAYQGKVLGHVYFSGDRTALNAPATTTTVAATPPPATSQTATDANPPTPANPQSSETVKEITFTARNSTPSTTQPSRSSSSLPVPPTVSSGQSPTPNPTSTDSEELPPLPAPPQSNNSQVVPQPTATTRNNSERTVSDVMGVAPRSLPNGNNTNVATRPVASNYRVLIEAANSSQQKQLRSLYPDSFQTVYQGRSMWQVGVFTTWDNADKALQSAKNVGLEGLILE
jgi:hypothetical protein